jgi:hypothetical protein
VANETARREAGAALVEALDVLSAALPRAVELARTEERAAERAAVVAWLRECALDCFATRAEMRLLQDHATRIERGWHVRGKEP